MNIKPSIEKLFSGGYEMVIFNKSESSEKKQAAMVLGVKDGKVLILRRSNKEKWMAGRWNLPGGTVEKEETPKDAARRECREESGLVPEKLKLMMRIEKNHIVLWIFKSELPNDEILLDPREALDYAWINKESVENYHFVPDCKDWIIKFFQDDI